LQVRNSCQPDRLEPAKPVAANTYTKALAGVAPSATYTNAHDIPANAYTNAPAAPTNNPYTNFPGVPVVNNTHTNPPANNPNTNAPAGPMEVVEPGKEYIALSDLGSPKAAETPYGPILARYNIELSRKLGSGAFGDVYKGIQKEETVAVKFLQVITIKL